MLLVTNASRKKGGNSIPWCGSRDDCDGIWCPGKGKHGKCYVWTCDLEEDCRKIVRCKGLPGPYCMEGLCTC